MKSAPLNRNGKTPLDAKSEVSLRQIARYEFASTDTLGTYQGIPSTAVIVKDAVSCSLRTFGTYSQAPCKEAILDEIARRLKILMQQSPQSNTGSTKMR